MDKPREKSVGTSSDELCGSDSGRGECRWTRNEVKSKDCCYKPCSKLRAERRCHPQGRSACVGAGGCGLTGPLSVGYPGFAKR